MRIVGIQGCNHNIGLTCLRSMLCTRSNEEKKCPLCRTVWINALGARSQQMPRPPGIARLLNDRDRFAARVARQAGRSSETQAPGPLVNRNISNAADRSPPLTQTRNRNQWDTTMQNGVWLGSDMEGEDYETQLQHFEQFNRDIEHVRLRARSTHFGRSRRHQESRRRFSNSAGTQRAESNDEDTKMVGEAKPSTGTGPFSLFSPYLNPFRRAQDPMPAPGMDAVNDQDGAGTRSSPSQSNMEITSPPLPSAGSGAVEVFEHIRIPHPSQWDPRRAVQLDQREAELMKRERRLMERARSLDVREGELNDMEERFIGLRHLISAHQNEMRDLLQGQTHQLERAMLGSRGGV